MMFVDLFVVCWLEPVNGTPISPKGMKFTPVDIGCWKPADLDSQRNKKQLNAVVAQNIPPLLEKDQSKFRLCNLGSEKSSTTSSYSVEVPAATPWFESWRETFLRLHSESQISQYDFLHHFIACILVISSAEAKSPEELTSAVDRLSKMQLQHQSEWPNTWTFTSVLKFYLIVHDKSTVEQARYELESKHIIPGY
jgi:hypothetical protein